MNTLLQDKAAMIEMLTAAFYDNKSVTDLVPSGHGKRQRIRCLMAYAWEVCIRYGRVISTGDHLGCALVVYPDTRETNFWSLWQDLKLLCFGIGLIRIAKAIRRERMIKGLHPADRLCYVLFLGVLPQEQGKGIGSKLLIELIELARSSGRLLCLETSSPENVSWYQRFGLEVYVEKDIGYTLFFLKQAP